MTDLVVRRLLIDLETPFPGRWNGGDAFRSAFFNALSLSFPAGEQYLHRRGAGRPEGLAAKTNAPPWRPKCRASSARRPRTGASTRLFNANLDAPGLRQRDRAPGQPARRGRARRRRPAQQGRCHGRHRAFHRHLRRLAAAPSGGARRRRAAPADAVAVAQRRRVGAPQYRVRHVPGAGRQPRVADHASSNTSRPRSCTTCCARPCATCGTTAACSTGAPGAAPATMLFGRDGLIRGNYGLWKDYIAPDFHPSQQSRQPVAALVARQRRPVRRGRQDVLIMSGSRQPGCRVGVSRSRHHPQRELPA